MVNYPKIPKIPPSQALPHFWCVPLHINIRSIQVVLKLTLTGTDYSSKVITSLKICNYHGYNQNTWAQFKSYQNLTIGVGGAH